MPRKALSFLCLLATAGMGLYLAQAQVVIVHPGTLEGTVSLSVPADHEPLTQFEIVVSPDSPSSNVSRATFAVAPPSAGRSYEMQLDGGDPADEADPGYEYFVSMVAYFGDPMLRRSLLTVRHPDRARIDNPDGHDEVSYALPLLRKITAEVSVPLGGGTISYVNVYASTTTAAGEVYQAELNRSFPAPASGPTTLAASCLFPPVPNVYVRGSAHVRTPGGDLLVYSLGGSLRDLSNADATITWSIRANDSSATGNVSFSTANPDQVLPASATVIFQGPVNATTVVDAGSYAISLPAGTYQSHLSLAFPAPNLYTPANVSYTAASTVQLTPGVTSLKSFAEVLNSLTTTFELHGFFSLEDVTTQIFPRRIDPVLHNDQSDAFAENGVVRLGVTAGRWVLNGFVLGTSLETERGWIDVLFWKSFPGDAVEPQVVDVIDSAQDYAFPAQQLTMSRTTLYLSVAAPAGGPPVLLTAPWGIASKVEIGPEGDRLYTASGFSLGAVVDPAPPAPFVPLTLMAEPGEYHLSAFATSNGNTMLFDEPSLFIGEPMESGPGQVVLNPVQDQGLQITLQFDATTTEGVTSVVKSSLGPSPPAGFASLCSTDQPSGPCAPTYYNVDTTVQTLGPVDMCVRQAYTGVDEADLPDILATLALWHFRAEDNGTPPGWEKLPAPQGKPRSIDCATNLATCGCSHSAECGISQGVRVLQVCGVTTSFSPFSVLRSAQQFTSTESGPTGSVQQWTAPAAGTYRIRAVGAKGGAGSNSSARSGGCGAQLSGDFTLAAGDVLQLLIGQRGGSTGFNGGGGGGSFVAKLGAPLLVAGGGAGVSSSATVNGRNASLTQTGSSGSTSAGYTSGFVPGGTTGRGGSRAAGYGAGGGGWLGNGATDGTYGEGGFSFLTAGANQGRGGRGLLCDGPPFADGGFGGGGAGNGCYGGGGGGGYSGGGGGRVGGGGGSWNTGANPQASVRCTASGNGAISIERLD